MTQPKGETNRAIDPQRKREKTRGKMTVQQTLYFELKTAFPIGFAYQ